MAVYFLRGRHVSRGKGARVTRAAAYRAGECIRDERTSEVHNFSDRRDISYKEVVLPAELAGRADMAWTQDRSTLWNAAEHAGGRRNARLAREWLVFLPPELNANQRIGLVRTFASELADKYRCAVDACIHEPRPGADARNHHAHLLMTIREVTPDGFGPRTTLDMGDRERRWAGLGSSREEYLLIRERWAQVTNHALQHAGLEARVDHRSLKHQGIDREPTPTIPEKVFYAERKSGGHSEAGDAIRARHRERLRAREHSSGELERVLAKQKAELKARAIEDFKRKEAEPKRVRWNQLTRAERNEHRREQHQVRRAREKGDPVLEAQRREVFRQRARARRLKDPEKVREEQRAYRKAHADELNRKQREYRHARAERAREGPALTTAEQSVKNWNAYRKSHPPSPTAEESVRNWLTFREAQQASDAGKSRVFDEYARGPAGEGKDEPATKPTGPDHDFGI